MSNEKKTPAASGPAQAPDGVTIFPAPAPAEEKTEATADPTPQEGKTEETPAEAIRRRLQEDAAKVKEAREAMKEGKGILALETPIKAAGNEITELPYDFTVLTGMEYTDAMDGDTRGNTQKINGITYRQALNLFATAVAKEVEALDATDIITRIGVTDATAAVQLATLFFTASIRAGQKRISRKSSQRG